jgi:hypothetical protein
MLDIVYKSERLTVSCRCHKRGLTTGGSKRIMRGVSYYKGHTIGWDWAGQFATATRAEKRLILRRLQRMTQALSPFVDGVWAGILDRAEGRYDALRAGVTARSNRTHRLAEVVERLV